MTPYPKAVLFDWDNTLVDTLALALESMNVTLAHFSLDPWSMEDLVGRPHLSARDSFYEIFGAQAVTAMEVYHRFFQEHHLTRIRPLPMAGDLLDFLNGHGIPMSIISNKLGNLLRLEVEKLGWGKYFSSVIGSKDLACDKPFPLPVETVLQKKNMEASHDIWFVGDSITDVECAEYSGCRPVFVGTHLDERRKSLPHLIMANGCAGIMDLLRESTSKARGIKI